MSWATPLISTAFAYTACSVTALITTGDPIRLNTYKNWKAALKSQESTDPQRDYALCKIIKHDSEFFQKTFLSPAHAVIGGPFILLMRSLETRFWPDQYEISPLHQRLSNQVDYAVVRACND